MKERGIPFCAPMVLALLDGRKTMTRRVVKPQPEWRENVSIPGHYATFGKGGWNLDSDIGMAGFVSTCPLGVPGDRLIVCSHIPKLSHMYCAGTDGNIYSRARGSWRMLKAFRNHKGYEVVTIMDGARKLTRNVHRLVCSAFYGPPPTPESQVRHLDGNPEHGTPDNLAWGSQYDNWQDRKAHGNGCEGEKHHHSKFTDEERGHIRWSIAQGLCSQRHASKVLGLSQSAIYEMMDGAELHPAIVSDPGTRIPRITLEITGVRVERLNDISINDVLEEGTELGSRACYEYIDGIPVACYPQPDEAATLDNFIGIWESIHGPGSWDLNPWVWCIEFRVTR